ncbi:MAG: enoyl-CoA hydratase/isomerase family protein [Proteobacteria bacterium]|nr:enoyl-CoA hydratase/isomerase family protein [Pseudomonadota bacterium]
MSDSQSTAERPPLTLHVDDGIAVVTLDRPSSFNAIDLELARALLAAATAIAGDGGVRAVLLRGAGRSFCAGGDVKAMQAHAHDLPGFIGQVIDAFHGAVLALARLPVPVLAAVQGAAAGGGFSLAMAADLVIAARSARFVVAYPQLGASTDGGLSWQLQQRLGAPRALALLTLQGALTAQAAADAHLVHAVVDDELLPSDARRQVQAWAALPPQALRELKGLLRAPGLDGLAQQLAREKAAFLRCAATPDFAARVAAFAARGASTFAARGASTFAARGAAT